MILFCCCMLMPGFYAHWPLYHKCSWVVSTLLTSFKLPGWSITTERSHAIIYGYPLVFLLDLTIHWDLWVTPQYSLIGLCQCFLIDQERSFGCSTVDATSIGFLLENLSLYSSFVRNNALSYMTLTMKLMKVWFKMSEWSCHNFSCLVLSSFCSWCNFSSFRNTSPILWNL